MPFAHYAKLSASRQRIYRRSDAIETPSSPCPSRRRGGCVIVARIPRAGLAADEVATVQRASQALAENALRGLPRTADPAPRARAACSRATTARLHGLLTNPRKAGRPARITVMDAHRRQAAGSSPFKTFCAPWVHEVGHHLDYELFKLEETFHTDGFYKRESSLANALLAQEAEATSGSGRHLTLSPLTRNISARCPQPIT